MNRWLEENGYLVVDDALRGKDYLAGIDWSRTTAFAIGLTGIFLNVRGNFEHGIVEPGDAAQVLRDEIAAKLIAIQPPDTKQLMRIVD